MNTKSHTIAKSIAAVLTASALFLVACSDRESSSMQANVEQAVDKTKDALSDSWNSIKDFTYDKRDDFTKNAKSLSARLEAETSALQAELAGAQASASRKAALEELKSSQADLDAKLAALGRASGDTWDQAKKEVAAAWDRAQAAYHKARSS